MVWRICSPVSRWFSSWNRPISCRWRPNDLDNRMPLTLSVSSVIAVMSAMVFCVLLRDLAARAPDLDGEPQEQRQQRQRQDGERHRQDQHRDQRADDRDDVGEHVGRGVGHHVLHPAHVVGQPRLDLAGPGGGEEPQRHELQVGVQRVPQVLHDAQAHQVGHVGLADADDAGDDRHRDHQRPRTGTAAAGWGRPDPRSRWSWAGCRTARC